MPLPIAIYRVRSSIANREYHLAVPSADVDYVTDGLILLASTDKEEISLLYATSDEYQMEMLQSAISCAQRQNLKESRTDLVPIYLELNFRSPFKPKFQFRDIFSTSNLTDTISEVSQDEFLFIGGSLRDLR
jgi:hypothetical protein